MSCAETLANWLTEKTNAIKTEIKSISQLNGGSSMYTWEIMASFEGGLLEGTSRLILRSQSDTPLLPSIGIDCEFQLLKFLKSKKFKVPKPIYLDRSGLWTGNPAFIMQNNRVVKIYRG